MKKEKEVKEVKEVKKISETETLKQQLEEQKSKYLRALADLDNYKKRANTEKEEIAKFSNELLIKELLPALDGFDKAIEHAKSEELIKGLRLIKKQMSDALAKFGVAEVEAVGKKYDPNFHEAILMRESDKESGTVIEETQKGYMMQGRLIRPAMVIVSK